MNKYVISVLVVAAVVLGGAAVHFVPLVWSPFKPAELPYVKVPDSVQGNVGDFLTVKSDTNGKVVKWVSMDAGLKMFPSDFLKDTKSAIVSAGAPGQYRLLVYTALGSVPSDPVMVVIKVGGDPGPGPGPGPNPTPTDPLVKSLQAALDGDTTADKLSKVKQLSLFYKQSGTTFVNKSEYTTVYDLRKAMSAAISDLIGSDCLTPVRHAIANEMNIQLPTNSNAELDSATRKKATEQFTRVGVSLEVLK